MSDEALATIITGLIGFAGLSWVAWWNSSLNRKARKEERDTHARENAEIIMADLVYLAQVYDHLNTFTLPPDSVNVGNMAGFIGQTSNQHSESVIRFSDKLEILRGIPHQVIIDMGKLKEMDIRFRYQFTREDPITDAGGPQKLFESWLKQYIAVQAVTMGIALHLKDKFGIEDGINSRPGWNSTALQEAISLLPPPEAESGSEKPRTAPRTQRAPKTQAPE